MKTQLELFLSSCRDGVFRHVRAYLEKRTASLPPAKAHFLSFGGDVRDWLPHYGGGLASLPVLTAAAAGLEVLGGLLFGEEVLVQLGLDVLELCVPGLVDPLDFVRVQLFYATQRFAGIGPCSWSGGISPTERPAGRPS